MLVPALLLAAAAAAATSVAPPAAPVPGWSELSNPVIRTDADLRRHLARCRQISRHVVHVGHRLPSSPDTLPFRQWLRDVNVEAQLFVLFADPASPGEGWRFDLRTTDDPAVVRLRDEVDLAPPPGWVFVRRYRRAEMPALVDQAFRDERTGGVTLNHRYVALPRDGDDEGWRAHERAVLSHELVHAYVNSRLGPARDRLPRWFHEATAIYVSGSNVGMPRGVQKTAHGEVWSYTEPTEEYLAYGGIFRALEATAGQAAVLTLIREAVERGDLTAGLEAIGIPSEAHLLAVAEAWLADEAEAARRREERDALLIAGGIALLVIGAGVALWLQSRRDWLV